MKTKKTKILKRILPLVFAGLLLCGGCGEKSVPVENAAEEVGTETEEYRPVFDGTADEDNSPEGTEMTESESGTEAEGESEDSAEATEALIQKWTEKKLSEMTLEEKVAQLFYVTPEQLTGANPVIAAGSTTESALNSCPVGGLIYADQNFVDGKQMRAMLGAVQGFALKDQDLPLFLGVDEEGGRVRRIGSQEAADVPEVGSMLEYAESGAGAVYVAEDTIGSYLQNLGFNMDFAPVADVLTNPENEVIGDRSFGTDAAYVAECADAYANALRENEIIPVYKHFPGHGGFEDAAFGGGNCLRGQYCR